MSFTSELAYPKKVLSSLRPGDTVTIKISAYLESDPKGQPFTVVLTKVEEGYPDENGNEGLPILNWEPRGDIDMMDGFDEKFAAAYCNAAFVVDIVDRAPYVVKYDVVRNNLAKSPRAHRDLWAAHKKGPCVAVTGYRLAEWLLAKDPMLDIPNGISEERFASEWEKAGFPGLRGFYSYDADAVVARRDESGNNQPWIHKPSFKKWLLRRIPNVIRTNAEFKKDMADVARRERQMNEEDMDRWDSNDILSRDADNEDDYDDRLSGREGVQGYGR